MIKKIIFILLATIIYACTNNKTTEQEVSLVYSEIELNERFKALLQQFIEENPCENCVIRVYIDKVYEMKKNIDYGNIITIYQQPLRRDPYHELDPSPILKARIGSTIFYIHSGIEDYLNVTKDKPKSAENNAEGNFADWTVIDKNGSFDIYRGSLRQPFPALHLFPMPEFLEIDDYLLMP